MSAEHKPDCKFKDFHKSLTSCDPNGPDSLLQISDKHISFEYNSYTRNPNKDIEIQFNFCPLCGVAYNQD